MLSAAAIPLVVAVILFPCLIGWRALAGFDYLPAWYPFMDFMQRHVRADGTLPFWMPQLLCGMPLGEAVGVSVYYPVELLGAWTGVPPPLLYAWDAALHLALGGLGVWRLARGLGAPPAAAWLGGIGYAVGGYTLQHLALGTVLSLRATAWLPWILLAADRAAAGLPWGWAALAAPLALLALSGSFQALACDVVALPAFVALGRRRGSRLAAVGRLAPAYAACGALAAVTLVPCARYFLLSMRHERPQAWAGQFPFTRWDAATLLVPDCWGSALDSFGPSQYVTNHVGLVIAGFAAAGCLLDWRTARRWVVVASLALLLALGNDTPVGRVVLGLPFWRSFRGARHWLGFVQLAVPLLAALGAAAVMRAGRRGWRTLAAAWLAAALVLGGLRLFESPAWHWLARRAWLAERIRQQPGREAEMRTLFGRAAGRAAALCAGCAGAAAAVSAAPASAALYVVVAGSVAAVELLRPLLPTLNAMDAAAVKRSDPGDEPLARFLLAQPGPFRTFSEEYHVLLNLRLPTGLEWVAGYHGAPLGLFARFYDATLNCPDRVRLDAWLNTRYLVLRDPSPYPSLRIVRAFTNAADERFVLCENPQCLPRAFLARAAVAAVSDAETMANLCVEEPAGRTVRLAGRDAARYTGVFRGGRVTGLRLDPNRIEADVESHGPGLAVFSEVFYPAWAAFVDGTRVPLVRANVLLRAVPVAAGRHHLVLVFDSTLFKLGLWLACAAWAALGYYSWMISSLPKENAEGGAAAGS